MRVAYLVNQYPAFSHSFIRREIQAVEVQGITVLPVSIRPPGRPLPEAADRAESTRTWCILEGGVACLLAAVVALAIRRPRRLAAALLLALRAGLGSDRGVARHLAYLAEACRLVPWLAARDVAHVHAHFGTNPAAVAMLARALGGPPYSFTAHGPDEFRKARRLKIPLKARRAAFVVAVTEHGLARLHELAPDAADRLRLVRCGLDPSFLDAAPTPIPAAARFVCIGRLCDEKRQDLIVRAAADLRRRGHEVEVVLIGDGPTRGALASLAAELSAPVRFAGPLDAAAIRAQLAAARALVLPSDAEGLPSAIMEAFALSRPVITTPVGGIAELVVHGVNGWLVPPGSVSELTSAMQAALDATPTDLLAMAEHGRRAVHERHDARRAGATLASLFRQSVPLAGPTRPQTTQPRLMINLEPLPQAHAAAAEPADAANSRPDGSLSTPQTHV